VRVLEDGPRAGALPDHDVELIVFHRGIQNLFNRRRHPMDLVDEEHFARLEVRDDADEVAGLFDRRS
jgi:hypothetical protein